MELLVKVNRQPPIDCPVGDSNGGEDNHQREEARQAGKLDERWQEAERGLFWLVFARPAAFAKRQLQDDHIKHTGRSKEQKCPAPTVRLSQPRPSSAAKDNAEV